LKIVPEEYSFMGADKSTCRFQISKKSFLRRLLFITLLQNKMNTDRILILTGSPACSIKSNGFIIG